LLFADDATVCLDDRNGVDPDFASDYQIDHQCIDDNHGQQQQQYTIADAGEVLRAIASSPHLRAAPLILLFLSSTVLVVGVVLTHKEFRQCWSWLQSCQVYGEECSQQLMKSMGVSSQEELTQKMKENVTQWKNKVAEQLEQSMDRSEGLVLDDILRQWVKSGVEFSMGVWGGIVLYSIPEEIFVDSSHGAKTARRRLVRAADPSLEQILFRPGGIRDMVPPNWMEYLNKSMVLKQIEAETELDIADRDQKDTDMEILSEGSSTENCTNDIDEDSSDTPLASPVSPAVDARASCESSAEIRLAKVVRAEGREIILQQNQDKECQRETLPDAMSATIYDVVVSNLTSSKKRPSLEHDKKAESQQTQEPTQGPQNGPSLPSTPQMKLETFLRHTSMAASFLFLCHLRSSHHTRRAWGSAIKLLTSLGLVSLAMGSGAASAMLSSNAIEFGAMASHPIIGMLYSSILDLSSVSQMCQISTDIHGRIQNIFNQIREVIQKNKRLQAALAFIVLHGMRSLLKKGGPIPRRKGIQ